MNEEFIKLLNIKFPRAWFKKGEDFSDEFKGSIWTGENSFVDDKGTPMFNCNGNTKSYKFGAHIKLCEFIEKHGFYIEPYDCGTYFIFKI